MDLSNVDVEKIYDIIEEISSIIANINNEGEKISSSCDSLIQNCNLLNDYSGQEVVGSKMQKQVMKDQNGEQIYSHTEVTWKEWNISGCDLIISKSETISKMIMDIENAINNVSKLTSSTQLDAEAIEAYVSQTNDIMDSITSEQRQILLDTFKDYKAEDEFSAISGNYTGINPENEQYWTDTAMYARYDTKTGAVLVYQIVDGQEVGMGWIPANKWIEGISKIQKSESTMEKLKDLGIDIGNKIINYGATVLGSASTISDNLKNSIKLKQIEERAEKVIEQSLGKKEDISYEKILDPNTGKFFTRSHSNRYTTITTNDGTTTTIYDPNNSYNPISNKQNTNSYESLVHGSEDASSSAYDTNNSNGIPEKVFDSQSGTFVDPIEILDDNSSVVYANGDDSNLETFHFDSNTGKFISDESSSSNGYESRGGGGKF